MMLHPTGKKGLTCYEGLTRSGTNSIFTLSSVFLMRAKLNIFRSGQAVRKQVPVKDVFVTITDITEMRGWLFQRGVAELWLAISHPRPLPRGLFGSYEQSSRWIHKFNARNTRGI